MTNEQLWQAVLGELELTLSKANFTTWFKNTFIISQENNKVIIGVPNAFTKTWLENKYHKSIISALQNVTAGKINEVTYKVEVLKTPTKSEAFKKIAAMAKEKIAAPTPLETEVQNGFGLNPRYTFGTFVVGKGNELANAACLAVVQKPGEVYNPLFLYGGAGLGKTHLMQAIAHETLKRYPEKKTIYVTCEKFTNEFIQSIREGRGDKFKNVYRNAYILLIDDVQFLAGKESTQEEFFHTFNTLHQANKQIVISSDRPPKAIPTLENRLISRFECGMIADIGQPDLETRIAILETKAKEKNYTLPREIINYIAANIQNNVRELEGALNRVMAYHQLNNTPPNLELVKNILNSLTTYRKRSGALTARQLLSTVAEFYDISSDDLVGSSRKRELVTPRQIVMYLMREEIRSSYPAIGQELGGRDHTTAMHACEKIRRLIEEDEKIRQDIHLIRQRIYNK